MLHVFLNFQWARLGKFSGWWQKHKTASGNLEVSLKPWLRTVLQLLSPHSISRSKSQAQALVREVLTNYVAEIKSSGREMCLLPFVNKPRLKRVYTVQIPLLEILGKAKLYRQKTNQWLRPEVGEGDISEWFGVVEMFYILIVISRKKHFAEG